MSFVIGLLTVVMVLDSLLLILLVLIQLPKKEAGAGVAFGGGATDALFGAGSGNALTKITRYAATIFFSLALLISFLYARQNPKNDSNLGKQIKAASAAAASQAPPATAAPVVTAAPTNTLLTIPTPATPASAPAATSTSSTPAQPVAPPK